MFSISKVFGFVLPCLYLKSWFCLSSWRPDSWTKLKVDPWTFFYLLLFSSYVNTIFKILHSRLSPLKVRTVKIFLGRVLDDFYLMWMFHMRILASEFIIPNISQNDNIEITTVTWVVQMLLWLFWYLLGMPVSFPLDKGFPMQVRLCYIAYATSLIWNRT